MHRLISSAALVVAGFFSPSMQAQTAPPNGWSDHISGCFASDPTFSDNGRGFERLPTPTNAQRLTTTFSGQQVRMAVWRQDCANNTAFPILMVRFENISPSGALVMQNRDFELLQGSSNTFAEEPGYCAAGVCRVVSLPVYDERGQIQFATWAIAQARDANVLLRNGFQFRLRGTTQAVTIGATTGGGGDLPMAGRLNGTYFDPARSGEGILVDFFDAGANKGVFVSWYTFDDAGNPLWLVGNATLAPNGTQVDVPLIVTRGGRFGPLFNAADITRTGWGTVNLRFPNCSTAVMRYTRTSDGQTGQYTMSRLGPASGVSC